MKLKLALAAATVLSASAAFATPVSLTYLGNTGSQTVTVTSFPGGTSGIAGNDNVTSASTFEMRDTTPGGLGDFFAWCLDLGAFLGSGGEYKITNTPFENGGVDLTATGADGLTGVERVSAVINANYSVDITEDSVKSAGFQMALWESVYDTGFNIASGMFAATSAAAGQAQTYLTAASTYVNSDSGPDMWNALFLESTEGQNGVGRTQHLVTVAAVPLPASALLLLAGLGAFGMARRRQSA